MPKYTRKRRGSSRAFKGLGAAIAKGISSAGRRTASAAARRNARNAFIGQQAQSFVSPQAAYASMMRGERVRDRSFKNAQGEITPLYGYGGFWDDAWNVTKKIGKAVVPTGTFASLGSAAGSALGGMVGQAGLGASAGNWLGGQAANVAGFGEYRGGKGPSVISEGMDVPQIVNYHGGTVVRHREYLGDVLASDDFQVKRYQINPADASVFPWLSQQSGSYQQYRMRGMIFTFRSTSGDSTSSANTSIGSVMFSTDYDVNDPAPYSKAGMLNQQYSVDAKPSANVNHIVECDPAKSRNNGVYHIRDRAVSYTNGTLKDYDYASVYIATDGMQLSGGARHVIGELWVSYEIELMKPQLLDMTKKVPFSQYIAKGAVATNLNPLGILLSTSKIEPDTHNPENHDAPIVLKNPGASDKNGFAEGSNLGLQIRCENTATLASVGSKYRLTFGDRVTSGIYEVEYMSADYNTAVMRQNILSTISVGTNCSIVESQPGHGTFTMLFPHTAATNQQMGMVRKRFKIIKNDGKRNDGQTYVDVTIDARCIHPSSGTGIDDDHASVLTVRPINTDNDITYV